MDDRVSELAAELGVTSSFVLKKLAELGERGLTESSPLRTSTARQMREWVRNQDKSLDDLPDRTSRQSSWRAGAVRPPIHPDTIKNVNTLKRRFNIANEHQESLNSLGSQFLFANYCKVAGSEDCMVGLVRFSGAIESAFGMTREVMFFYSPYPDLQNRTFKAARRTIANLDREVTPDIIFLWSPDPRLREKLDDWSSHSFLAIPLDIESGAPPISFVSLIRDYIFTRDLFYETTPVQGDNFFGRRQLLQSLRDDVKNQRVAGLFGLRKAGKKSVLSELSHSISGPENIVLLRDLESLPSPPKDPVPQLVQELVGDLSAQLETRSIDFKELGKLIDKPDLAQFKSALQAVMRKLNQSGIAVVVLLDEIEYLTPSDRIDIHEGPMTTISQFLGVLRSLVQENENFTFLLSGLTSAIVEDGRLYGRPNPLFSWAKAHYLAPFERYEADDLALSLGRKMGIEIQESALSALFEASGGHAFLYRHLASLVVSKLPVDVFSRIIVRRDVLHVQTDWHRLIAGNMREMLDHVRRYYPDEAFLLDVLRDEPEEFESLSVMSQSALGHLLSLGLIIRDGNGYELTPVLQLT